MNTTLETVTPSRNNLIITLTAEEVAQERASITGKFASQAKVPGFRPGKAPRDMIARRFRKDINGELQRHLVSAKLQEGIKKEKLNVFGVVEFKGPDSFEKDEDMTLTYTLDLNPTFDLPEYSDIKLEAPDTAVTDEEVDTRLQEIRQQRADFKVVERPAASGDYAKVSYTGTIDGQPIAEIVPERPIYGTQNNTWEEVGNADYGIPGLPEALAGLSAGEEKTIDVTFPEDFAEKELAGKKASYAVKMEEVRERTLPELDEEFLKGLQVETVEELKTRLRRELQGQKWRDAHFKNRRELGDQLAGRVEFALPESPVESRTQQYLQQLVEQNTRQGVKREDLEQNKEALYASARQSAESRVKLEYILFKIAEKEKITLTQEDMQRVVMNEAMRSGRKPQDLVKEWQKDEEGLREIQRSVLFDKTLDLLVERATPAPEESEEPSTVESTS